MLHSISPDRRRVALATIAALAVFVAVLAPTGAMASDHLDAPGQTSPGDDPQADVNDLYVFEGSSEDSTVMAATFVPDAAVDASFGSDVLYELKVDEDGDAVEDLSYEFTFSDVRDDGSQFFLVQGSTGEDAADGSANGDVIAYGQVGQTVTLPDGIQVFTGLRSDPFFFDLAAFLGQIEGEDNGRAFEDGDETDFYAGLDALAIVVERPDFEGEIGVWATTSDAEGNQIDRVGKPAMNMLIHSVPSGNDEAGKDAYNAGEPADDDTDFSAALEDALIALSADDTEMAFSPADAASIADLLLPDVLTYDPDGTDPAPLNGRALDDDVMDFMLNLFSGGDPLDTLGGTRDETGAIPSDGVDAHDDYLDAFPYLGEPNGDYAMPVLGGEQFLAELSGAEEVPPVTTRARGATMLNADIDHLTIANALEDATAAHIHIGDPGENGPVVAFLFGPVDPTDVDGKLSEGTLDADEDLVAGTVDDLVDVMRGGFAYVNVHTTDNPAGEIRGQIGALDVVEDRFDDSVDSVHAGNIDVIAAADITRGCNPPANTNFCPNDDITRGQMAAFLNRAFNLPTGPDAFEDDDTNEFEADINALAAADVTRGCNPPANTNFCPTDSLTRGQMAAFLNRALDLAPSDVDAFEDDDTSEFEADINALAASGITVGCNPPENTQFCPNDTLSRAQMASFLARAFGWGL